MLHVRRVPLVSGVCATETYGDGVEDPVGAYFEVVELRTDDRE